MAHGESRFPSRGNATCVCVVCGMYVHKHVGVCPCGCTWGRLENDFECPLPFSALGQGLLGNWKLGRFFFLWGLCWLASKLSGLTTLPSHSGRVHGHVWLFMWAQGIQTQYLMLIDQELSLTDSSPAPSGSS